METSHRKGPHAHPETRRRKIDDNKDRRPRPEVTSLQKSSDRTTAWWRTQSQSNLSPAGKFPANREINREFFEYFSLKQASNGLRRLAPRNSTVIPLGYTITGQFPVIPQNRRLNCENRQCGVQHQTL